MKENNHCVNRMNNSKGKQTHIRSLEKYFPAFLCRNNTKRSKDSNLMPKQGWKISIQSAGCPENISAAEASRENWTGTAWRKHWSNTLFPPAWRKRLSPSQSQFSPSAALLFAEMLFMPTKQRIPPEMTNAVGYFNGTPLSASSWGLLFPKPSGETGWGRALWMYCLSSPTS